LYQSILLSNGLMRRRYAKIDAVIREADRKFRWEREP